MPLNRHFPRPGETDPYIVVTYVNTNLNINLTWTNIKDILIVQNLSIAHNVNTFHQQKEQ